MSSAEPAIAPEPLFRINPRARRISIALCPARRRLILTAPSERARREAYAFFESRRGWAQRQLQRLPPAAPFREGQTLLLHGEQLVVRSAPGRGAPVLDAADGALLVPGRADALAGRVRRFLKAEAEADLGAALERHCAALDRAPPQFTLRDTRSRWGSCSSSGKLNFSWRLVCAPPFVLDYVAAHEAAHLAHHNHGPHFRLLERRLAPRADEASAWLASNGPLLHAVGAES